MKQFIFLIIIMLFMHTAITEAQTPFVQSRYVGAPQLATCSDCSIADDGTTHIRFKPGSARVDTDEGRVEFTVEIRRVGGPEGAERYIPSASFRLKYPTAIFGENLNDPDIQSGADGTQCTFLRSELFPDMKDVEVAPDILVPVSAYTLSFFDSFSDELTVDQTHASTTILSADRGAYSTLGAEWEDLITLSCEIPSGQTDNDAGLAIAGSQPTGIFYFRYPEGAGNATPATAFLVADNDLRGLRLDGKTWAEEYARYGDGMGVRIQFSKGIKDQLGADNFALGSGEANTMTVVHQAGSEWVHIRFERPVVGDILELVSNGTVGLLTDVDDNELADGNFIASLAYDAAAPRVIAVVEDSSHTGEGELKWDVTFSSALRADLAIPDNICLAKENACEDTETALPRIVSTALSADGSQLSVILSGGGRGTGGARVDKVGGTFSLELRRHSILGADLKVAEDYQADLRGIIELTDEIGPALTVVADGPAVPVLGASELRMSFTVTADEDTPNLNSTSSYQLIGITRNGIEKITANPTAITSESGQENRVLRVKYVIPFNSVLNLDSISAFTLARGSADDSLVDAAGNAPTNIDGDSIDADMRIDNSVAALATIREIDSDDIDSDDIDSDDIDSDDDGLIEIHNLEMLDAIRYQLDGSGYREGVGAAKITTGCAVGGCKGYELLRDLDFMDPASYASTANQVRWSLAWQVIGDLSEAFNATFEGNGHTLSNLRIGNSGAFYVGLFGNTGSSATIVNLGLLDSHVQGYGAVGGLVGWNEGRIINSYAMGTVLEMGTVLGAGEVGGLVAFNEGRIINSYATGSVVGGEDVGGLVGWNTGDITNSYATGSAAGKEDIGGLVGWNTGDIINSYATGSVAGGEDVGGLVGWNRGSIINSYATGPVSGDRNVGGLVGWNRDGSVTDSYWDVQTSGIEASAGGVGKTTAELQSPTTASDIYSSWSSADWDFGDPTHYPILNYAVGSDPSKPACDVPEQPVCGALLPHQIRFLEELAVVNGTLSPLFMPERVDYEVTVAFDTTHLELQTTASGASFRIRSDTSDIEVLATHTTRAVIPLSLGTDTVITVTVGPRPTRYQLSVSYASDDTPKPFAPVVAVDGTQTISEGDTVTMRATLESGSICGTDLRCGWAYSDAASRLVDFATMGLSDDPLRLDFRVPTDYVAASQTTRQLVLVFMLRNRGGLMSVATPLVIMKEDNGPISGEDIDLPTLSEQTLTAPEIDLADDPDGVNAVPALAYQWQRAQSGATDLSDPASWEDIEGATSKTYTLADRHFSPHRVQLSYLDGQAYNNISHTQWLRIRDIDSDDDGLIEIHNLEMLDAMRYQLDGSGYREDFDADKITTGCAVGGCKGYELLRDLDFLDPDSYASTANQVLWSIFWNPIGHGGAHFNATFEGNGYTLSNLRTGYFGTFNTGLFGHTGSSARIANLGLLDSHAHGSWIVGSLVSYNEGRITNSYATGSVLGWRGVGGLVGHNGGRIINSYAVGSVSGEGDNVGGLVGWNKGGIINSYATGSVSGEGDNVGGLVGANGGSITNSYATGPVAGEGDNVGGLVGENGDSITNSYAVGSVSGEGDNVGGLVGVNEEGDITNSYATGAVVGDRNTGNVGGLVGRNRDGSVTNSYWDVQTSGIEASVGGVGKSTAELQSPTTASDIYSNWSSADWDFGDPTHYPLLTYAVGSDPSKPVCGVPERPVCGALLPHQIRFLDELLVVNGTLSPLFMPERVDYEVTVAFDTTHLELQTTASGASLRIRSDTSDIEVLGINTARAVIPLSLETNTVITVTVGSRPTRYRFSVSYASDDVPKPSAPVLVVDGAQPVDEGDTVTVRATLESGSICGTDLRCGWAYIDAASRLVELTAMELSDDPLRLDFRVPTDHVAASQTTRQLVLVFILRNRGGLVSGATPLVVMKADNGPISEEGIDLPTLNERTLVAPEIDLAADLDGVNAVPAIAYQWQRVRSGATDLNDPASWEDIEGASDKTYTLADRHFTPHRVQLSYLDGQDYNNISHTRWLRIRDIDSDDDGLIEIHNLQMLDAIRYQLDGSGYREGFSAAKITTGCAVGGCKGYELMRDLDFMDPASYASTANQVQWSLAWQVIGAKLYDAFNASFEGNGHTLSNLRIDDFNAFYVGLFGNIESSATIVNLGLLNSHVQGDDDVGGLVGWNRGSIINSYVVGSISGLREEVGGLVAYNEGRITNSYVTGSVAGDSNVGGLVGVNRGSITNSYAMAAVSGEDSNVGGLAGWHAGSITNSYATGPVAGDSYVVGGLVSGQGGGSVTASYWDVQTSGIVISAGGTSKTTIELQSPTAATGIYSDWNSADWDFGASTHYPFLKYAVGTEPSNPACGVSGQPACGTLLPYQLPSLLAELRVANGTLSPPFAPEIMNYEVTVAFDTTHLELHTIASGASLHIQSDALYTEVLSTDTASVMIPLNLMDDTLIRIEVMEDTRRPTVYSLSVLYALDDTTAKLSTPIVVVDAARLIDEGATATLRVSNDYQCGVALRCQWYYRDAASQAIELADAKISTDSHQLIFAVPTDYVEPGQTTRQLIIVFAARNRGGLVNKKTTLVIMKQNNGSIDEGIVDPPILIGGTFNAPVIDLATDPDGVNANPELRYQWQRVKSGATDLDDPASWEDIDGATNKAYMVLGGAQALRVRIRYTDAQGYKNTIYSMPFETSLKVRIRVYLEAPL